MAISKIASKMVGAGLKAAKGVANTAPKLSKNAEVKSKLKDLGNEFLTNDDSPMNVKAIGSAAVGAINKTAKAIESSHSIADDGSQDNPLHTPPLHHDDL